VREVEGRVSHPTGNPGSGSGRGREGRGREKGK